jgi:hypothetical protein
VYVVVCAGHYSGRAAGAPQNILCSDRDRAGAFYPFFTTSLLVPFEELDNCDYR